MEESRQEKELKTRNGSGGGFLEAAQGAEVGFVLFEIRVLGGFQAHGEVGEAGVGESYNFV